jgi:hypothetical protein
MEMMRRVITNVAAPEGTRVPIGHIIKLRQYPDATFRDVTTPNAAHLLHGHAGGLCGRARAARQYKIVPLSAYGHAYTPPPGKVDPSIDMKTQSAIK